MSEALYAVVAYVTGELGEFVDALRAELVPAQAHLRAHLTLLPPRPLQGTVEQARRTLERLCRQLKPVEVGFGEVGVFIPITPTVYLSITEGADDVRAMHDKLNTGEFVCYEALPYLPHLTVAALATNREAERTAEIVRRRWAEYKGPRETTITTLTFAVDAENANSWDDIVTFPLTG